VANLKRVVAANGCYISDNRRAGVRDEGRRESKEKNIMLKSDPNAVKRFEDMFTKMKSGRGLPKELLNCLEEKKVVIEPEQLVDGQSLIELSTEQGEEDVGDEVEEIQLGEQEDESMDDED
jgi:hypothetical protein